VPSVPQTPRLMLFVKKDAVACDIVYSNVNAIDDGSTVAVLFVGKDT
jgi:hypothetical protein